VGDNVAGFLRGVARARVRVETADQRMGRAQRVVVAGQQALELDEVALGEQFQVVVDDAQRQVVRGVRGRGAQLQAQAFLRGARADAGRLQVLHVAQRDAQVVQIEVELLR